MTPPALFAAHTEWAEVKLLRGDFLASRRRGREEVSLPVNATPSQPMKVPKKKGKSTGTRKGETQDGIHTGVSRDVAQAEHASHGHDRETQTVKGWPRF